MITHSEAETETFGKTLAKKLTKKAVVALYGDLGAGKTTLAKGIVAALTDAEPKEVQSPTFTYLNIYNDYVYHFDLYRLKDEKAFIEMGFLDFFEQEGIFLIEWPERIEPLLPKGIIAISVKHIQNNQREIDVEER